MKYLHSREEVIALLRAESSSKEIAKAIEMLEAAEDKTRDHHFKKAA